MPALGASRTIERSSEIGGIQLLLAQSSTKTRKSNKNKKNIKFATEKGIPISRQGIGCGSLYEPKVPYSTGVSGKGPVR